MNNIINTPEARIEASQKLRAAREAAVSARLYYTDAEAVELGELALSGNEKVYPELITTDDAPAPFRSNLVTVNDVRFSVSAIRSLGSWQGALTPRKVAEMEVDFIEMPSILDA